MTWYLRIGGVRCHDVVRGDVVPSDRIGDVVRCHDVVPSDRRGQVS